MKKLVCRVRGAIRPAAFAASCLALSASTCLAQLPDDGVDVPQMVTDGTTRMGTYVAAIAGAVFVFYLAWTAIGKLRRVGK